MGTKILPFAVTGFHVRVEEGIRLKWLGRDIDSGPLVVTLGAEGSGGTIDYEAARVEVEFRVRVEFEELSEILRDLGAEPDLAAPVEAVIRSEGAVFEADHSLRLAGKAKIKPHKLFDPDETRIEIRAPSQ
ncbi:MAG TPA: hypothetical protein VHE35_02405 [Kofleriaceae bacterium]|nr:hypothetical protein [Kofleriaceae bacterium]